MDVFLLLVQPDVGKEIVCVDMVVAEFGEKVQQQRENGQFRVLFCVKILISHLDHQLVNILRDLGIGILGDIKGLGQNGLDAHKAL